MRREKLSIPIHVLIRPRSGDFTYSDAEFQIMKANIAECKAMGIHGIVTGVLHADFSLDEARTAALRAAAKDMHFTFHRGFDWVRDPFATLNKLELIGVDTLLSSGQETNAEKGLPLLKQLYSVARSCKILPGGGIRDTNAPLFIEAGFHGIHLSGSRFKKTLAEPPKIAMNTLSFLQEDRVALTDIETVSKVIKRVKGA